MENTQIAGNKPVLIYVRYAKIKQQKIEWRKKAAVGCNILQAHYAKKDSSG